MYPPWFERVCLIRWIIDLRITSECPFKWFETISATTLLDGRAFRMKRLSGEASETSLPSGTVSQIIYTAYSKLTVLVDVSVIKILGSLFWFTGVQETGPLLTHLFEARESKQSTFTDIVTIQSKVRVESEVTILDPIIHELLILPKGPQQ